MNFNTNDARLDQKASSIDTYSLVNDDINGGKSRGFALLTPLLTSPYSALALMGFLLGSNIQVLLPTVLGPELTEEMTYNGMTLADFSVEMGLPIDHPYLVALFEQLCMSDVA
ncbi:hypothetical protein SAMN05444003_1293 [Cognatiyoonia sediminum]|uniref:Uncharacterized protein n=1 Tax=Cognatiyoonia sediminum TaxID=1508389 RepID=A0A1M5NAT6_9RHOB|nr:hypothetical protein [Cognatiyoonia sediminum]SHG86726.1 hypothetical protein SAMN05444003_1293 [Cognatiyoonia sediminum]